MLRQPTLNLLHELRLTGMARADEWVAASAPVPLLDRRTSSR